MSATSIFLAAALVRIEATRSQQGGKGYSKDYHDAVDAMLVELQSLPLLPKPFQTEILLRAYSNFAQLRAEADSMREVMWRPRAAYWTEQDAILDSVLDPVHGWTGLYREPVQVTSPAAMLASGMQYQQIALAWEMTRNEFGDGKAPDIDEAVKACNVPSGEWKKLHPREVRRQENREQIDKWIRQNEEQLRQGKRAVQSLDPFIIKQLLGQVRVGSTVTTLREAYAQGYSVDEASKRFELHPKLVEKQYSIFADPDATGRIVATTSVDDSDEDDNDTLESRYADFDWEAATIESLSEFNNTELRALLKAYGNEVTQRQTKQELIQTAMLYKSQVQN